MFLEPVALAVTFHEARTAGPHAAVSSNAGILAYRAALVTREFTRICRGFFLVDRAEIGHILGVSSGQFHVVISACLDQPLQTRDKVTEVESSTVAAALNVSRCGDVTPRYLRT